MNATSPGPNSSCRYFPFAPKTPISESTGLEREQHAGDGRRDWKLRLRCELLRASRKRHRWRARKSELVTELAWLQAWIHRRRRRWRRDLALHDVDFFFRKPCDRFGRKTKILRQDVRRRASHPVGDAERSKLGEPAVVENEQKVAFARPETLNRMPVTFWKIPHVAGAEV